MNRPKVIVENPFPAQVQSLLKRQSLKKGEKVLLQGELCKHVCYVESGCLKSYVIDHKGKEHVLQFAPEGWFISDLNSFINKVPATLNITAIEDCMVIIYDHELVEAIKSVSPDYAYARIRTLQNNIIASQNRLILLLSASAEERYLGFIKTYPSLIKRIPQKYIASYLGITPESLSRVRKELAAR